MSTLPVNLPERLGRLGNSGLVVTRGTGVPRR